MSVMCDCKDCGGTEETFFCENKALEMQAYVAHSERIHTRILLISLVVIGLALMAFLH